MDSRRRPNAESIRIRRPITPVEHAQCVAHEHTRSLRGF
jgi:hypothetical protein